jgi:hypothetical protein
MAIDKILYVLTHSKAKKSPRLVRRVHVISRRFPVAAQDKEARHAL